MFIITIHSRLAGLSLLACSRDAPKRTEGLALTNKVLVKHKGYSLLLSERVHRGAETESSLGRSVRKYSWEKLLQNQLRVWRVCVCV